jgi:hypothetical protein
MVGFGHWVPCGSMVWKEAFSRWDEIVLY